MGSYLQKMQQKDDADLVQRGQQMLGPQGQSPLTPQAGRPQPPQQPQPQQRPQQQLPPSEQWNQLLGQLSQGYNELDEAGQSKLNEFSHKTEALLESRTQLRPKEFETAMGSLGTDAKDYPWERHVKPPGSNPGDIIEEEGIQKIRTAEGALEPFAFTADYIQKNTVKLGDTGQIAIPVSPKDGFKVVAAAPRDIASERGEIDKAEKGIGKIFDTLVKDATEREKTVYDDDGKKKGVVPFTSQEIRNMNIQASDAYIKQQLQAKHAAKTVADKGAGAAIIDGDVSDPFKQEREIMQLQQEKLLTGMARQDAAKDLMVQKGKQIGRKPPPTPSMDPGMAPGAQPPAAGGGLEALNAELGDTKTPEQRAADSLEYSEAKKALTSRVKATNFKDMLVEGAMIRPENVLRAPSKAEMNSMYAESPAGTVVELPDRRRYVKDGDKFMQIPWNYKQLASPVMLDAQGEEIMDPNTGKAAPGIIKQLEAGKSREMSPSGIARAAATSPPGQPAPSRAVQQARMAQAVGAPPPQAGQQQPVLPPVNSAQADARAWYQQSGKPRHPGMQPAAQPGKPAEPVTPERTQQVMAAGGRRAAAATPRPQPHQPALATQDAEKAAMQARHQAVAGADPQQVYREFKEMMDGSDKIRRAMRKPHRIKQPQEVAEIPVGQAFLTPEGYIFFKVGDNQVQGPFTEEMRQRWIQSNQEKRNKGQSGRPATPMFG